jgi:antitoxin VapB
MKESTIFMSGNSQAVRIPKEMRFKTGQKVLIEKIGNVTIIIDEGDPWASLKLAQALIAVDFMKNGRMQNKVVVRKGLEKVFKK